MLGTLYDEVSGDNLKYSQQTGDIDSELRRVCSLLEQVASQYDEGSPESKAIAAAAEAYIVVRQHKSLANAYQRLKAAKNGELDDEVLARLNALGIDVDDLEDDIDLDCSPDSS